VLMGAKVREGGGGGMGVVCWRSGGMVKWVGGRVEHRLSQGKKQHGSSNKKERGGTDKE